MVIAGVIAGAWSYYGEVNFWPAFAIISLAILVNGLIATVEDDMPGGFNNPQGEATPSYAKVLSWVGRATMFVFVGASIFVLVLWYVT